MNENNAKSELEQRTLETLFLNVASWADEHRQHFAPSCRETQAPEGGWWGRWDDAPGTSHFGIFLEKLRSVVWEELLRKPECIVETVPKVLQGWARLGLVKTHSGSPSVVIRTGDTTRRGVEFSLLHVERLRQERTT